MKTSKSLKIRDLSFNCASSLRSGLGFVVSKKYGDAVRRNLFKRRCRHLFKNIIIDNKILYSIVVVPNKQNISYSSLNESFTLLYNQLYN